MLVTMGWRTITTQRLETKTTLRIELGIESCTWFGCTQRMLVEAHLDCALHMVSLPWFDFDKTAVLYDVGISQELHHDLVIVHF